MNNHPMKSILLKRDGALEFFRALGRYRPPGGRPPSLDDILIYGAAVKLEEQERYMPRLLEDLKDFLEEEHHPEDHGVGPLLDRIYAALERVKGGPR